MSDMVMHPLAEIREWDEALAVLGIQDSNQTPADAIRELDARIEALEAALRFLFEETTWKSVDKDNMEFEGRVTCYQLDKARNALAPEQDK